MGTYQNQKEEIETIRERSITLKLSDADVRRICEKTGSFGITVPELLENFIGDLVDGTYSNGSDERMYAEQWFNRCWFSICQDDTFLQYLLYTGIVGDALLYWDEMKDYDNEEDREFYEESKEQLNELFNEYLGQLGKEHQTPTLEDEMEKVVKWRNEYQQLAAE